MKTSAVEEMRYRDQRAGDKIDELRWGFLLGLLALIFGTLIFIAVILARAPGLCEGL
jgi:hypothetical protein